jgi:hypothetical protein
MSQPPSSRKGLIRLVAGLLVPVIVFVAFLRTLGNATEALAISEAIPVLWVLAYAVWRRRIEPVGATAVAGVGIALLLTIALGGSPLPLELHRALFPGAVGIACLISLAARRPLLEIAKSRLANERPEATVQARPQLEASDAHHALAVLTAIIGVTTSADAAAQITLAFTVSPATFGLAAHIAAWVIIGVGLAACALYLRWTVRRQRDRTRPPGPQSAPGSHSPPTEPKEMPTSTRSPAGARS